MRPLNIVAGHVEGVAFHSDAYATLNASVRAFMSLARRQAQCPAASRRPMGEGTGGVTSLAGIVGRGGVTESDGRDRH
jgi:hypothetical protein